MAWKSLPVSYPSHNGLDTIRGRIWADQGMPVRAVLQVLHGMQDYFDNYGDLARFFLPQGIVVCGADHAGHGNSVGPNGYGYFADKNGVDCLVEDACTLMKIMKRDYPNTPYFLLGHSMGSFVAGEMAARAGGSIDGLILSGTGGPMPILPVGRMICRVIEALRGKKYVSRLADKIAFFGYNKKYDDDYGGFAWVSSLRPAAERMLSDEKRNFKFTIGAFHDMIRLIALNTSEQWAQRLPRDLPVYFYSGEMDPVGDYGRGVDKRVQALKRAGVRDVSAKIYPGARHEMHNERNARQAFADLADWLENHMGGIENASVY